MNCNFTNIKVVNVLLELPKKGILDKEKWNSVYYDSKDEEYVLFHRHKLTKEIVNAIYSEIGYEKLIDHLKEINSHNIEIVATVGPRDRDLPRKCYFFYEQEDIV